MREVLEAILVFIHWSVKRVRCRWYDRGDRALTFVGFVYQL